MDDWTTNRSHIHSQSQYVPKYSLFMSKAYKHTLLNAQKETAYENSVSERDEEPTYDIKLSSEIYHSFNTRSAETGPVVIAGKHGKLEIGSFSVKIAGLDFWKCGITDNM